MAEHHYLNLPGHQLIIIVLVEPSHSLQIKSNSHPVNYCIQHHPVNYCIQHHPVNYCIQHHQPSSNIHQLTVAGSRLWGFANGHERDAVVCYSHIALGVMTVGGLAHRFLRKGEGLGDVGPEDLPTHLHRDLVLHVAVVEQQWSEVSPGSSWFESSADRIHVLKHIVGRVQEEAGGHALEVDGSLVVDLAELSCCNAKVGLFLLPHFLGRGLVRDQNAPELVFFVPVVGRTDEGEYLKLLLLLGSVDDEVGPEQHEIGDFVPFCSEAGPHQFVDQPAESAPRHQHVVALFEEPAQGGYDALEVVFLGAFVAPLPVELFESRFDLAAVVGSSSGVRLGLLFFHLVDVVNDEVQEVLVMLERFFQHEGLALPVGLVEGIQWGVCEQSAVILLDILGVVAEGRFDLVLVLQFLLLRLQSISFEIILVPHPQLY